jgi:hypothetical protein
MSAPPEKTGDQGAYDPYAFGFLSDWMRVHGHNKKRPPFDSSEVRELVYRYYGKDAPGIYRYNAGEAEKKLLPHVDDNVCVFRSRSLQRPSSDNKVPGPSDYSPNHDSVEPHLANAVCSCT